MTDTLRFPMSAGIPPALNFYVRMDYISATYIANCIHD